MTPYQLHGLRFCSEIALGPPDAGEAPADLHVRWGKRCDIPDLPPEGRVLALPDPAVGGCVIVETPSGHTIRFPSSSDFFLSEDRRLVRVDATPSAEALVPILLAGTVIAAVLTLGGGCVLHASAVHLNEWTLAIVGGSGQGKSTLAALFCAAGSDLVSDDLLRVETDDGVARCYTGTPQIRLRPQAAALATAASAAGRGVTADGRVSLTASLAPGPVLGLDAVLVPNPSRTQPLSIRKLARKDALVELLRYPRVLGWQTIEPVRHHFRVCAAVAESIPVFESTIPWGPPFPPHLVTSILTQLRDRSL